MHILHVVMPLVPYIKDSKMNFNQFNKFPKLFCGNFVETHSFHRVLSNSLELFSQNSFIIYELYFLKKRPSKINDIFSKMFHPSVYNIAIWLLFVGMDVPQQTRRSKLIICIKRC